MATDYSPVAYTQNLRRVLNPMQGAPQVVPGRTLSVPNPQNAITQAMIQARVIDPIRNAQLMQMERARNKQALAMEQARIPLEAERFRKLTDPTLEREQRQQELGLGVYGKKKGIDHRYDKRSADHDFNLQKRAIEELEPKKTDALINRLRRELPIEIAREVTLARKLGKQALADKLRELQEYAPKEMAQKIQEAIAMVGVGVYQRRAFGAVDIALDMERLTQLVPEENRQEVAAELNKINQLSGPRRQAAVADLEAKWPSIKKELEYKRGSDAIARASEFAYRSTEREDIQKEERRANRLQLKTDREIAEEKRIYTLISVLGDEGVPKKMPRNLQALRSLRMKLEKDLGNKSKTNDAGARYYIGQLQKEYEDITSEKYVKEYHLDSKAQAARMFPGQQSKQQEHIVSRTFRLEHRQNETGDAYHRAANALKVFPPPPASPAHAPASEIPGLTETNQGTAENDKTVEQNMEDFSK